MQAGNLPRLKQFVASLVDVDLPTERLAGSQQEYAVRTIRGMANWLRVMGSTVDLLAEAKALDPLFHAGVVDQEKGGFLKAYPPAMDCRTMDETFCGLVARFRAEVARLYPECLRCRA